MALPIEARPGWQATVENDGVLWAVTEDGPYWNESMQQPVYYSFTKEEQEKLEEAGNEIHAKCLDTLTWLFEHADSETQEYWFDVFSIPNNYRKLIIDSWNSDEWGLYGRFDFFMTETGPKLLEYNAQTPTTLIESAITQYNWLVDNKLPNQFNEIHEALVRHWSDMKSQNNLPEKIHFAACSQVDDMATVVYMAETAKEAGLNVEVLPIEKIGYYDNQFIDLNNEPIEAVFALYPYEWLCEDEFGKYVPTSPTRWIEPPWKMLLSNKALLALLYKRYPECSYLVPAYIDEADFEPVENEKWVVKPLLSREGQNVSIWTCQKDGSMKQELDSGGEYDNGKYVYQKFIEGLTFDGCLPMLGVWMVGNDAVGLGIRESDTVITTNNSRFVPHIFE